MTYEGDGNQGNHHNALIEERLVLDGFVCVKLHDGRLLFGGSAHIAAIHHVEDGNGNNHDRDNGRAVECQEVHEGQVGGGADHDVRRVADERCRTADVGGHDLGDEERHGAQFEHLANCEGNGADKQYRSDVVQERGKDSGDNAEQHHDYPRVALRYLRCSNSDVFEYARILNYGNEYHHAYQDAQRAEVDVLHAGIETEDTSQDEHNGARKRGDRTVDLFRDDQREHHNEDHY